MRLFNVLMSLLDGYLAKITKIRQKPIIRDFII